MQETGNQSRLSPAICFKHTNSHDECFMLLLCEINGVNTTKICNIKSQLLKGVFW